MHTQFQELVDVKIKAKVDGNQMFRLYAKSCTEAKKMQKEAQKKEGYADQKKK